MRRLLLVLGASLLASSCAEPAREPAVPRPPAPPPRAPVLALWTPLDAPPSTKESRTIARLGTREVRLDAISTRWLLRAGSKPVRSQGLEQTTIDKLLLLDEGLLAIFADGSVRYAPDDVGPWRSVGGLPSTDGSAVLHEHRGGLVVRTGHGVGFLPTPSAGAPVDTAPVRWLPPFEGRVPLDARLNASGAGLVVFSPQRLAATKDAGRSYQLVDDEGVFADSLATDGERIFVLPGGEQDLFARVFEPSSAKLLRAHAPQPHPSQFVVGQDVAPLTRLDEVMEGRKEGEPAELRLSPSVWAASQDHLVAVDGDQVFLYVRGKGKGPLTAVLGEPLAPFDPQGKFPECKELASPFAACAGTRAMSCDGKLVLWTGDDKPHLLESPLQGLKLNLGQASWALGSPHDLFMADHYGVWYADLRTSTEPIQLLPPIERGGDALRIRCDEKFTAPLWIGRENVLGVEAVRRSATEGGLAAPHVLARPFGFDAARLGLAHDGSLILRLEQSGRLYLLHESGQSEERSLPGADPLALAVDFDDDGHGLAIERPSGRCWQSRDAGASWQPTLGPGRAIGDARLFCTRSRCEIEGLFLRQGWDDPALPAAARDSALPQATISRASGRPTVQCELVPARSPKLPADMPPEDIWPSFGPPGAMWVAPQVTSGDPVIPEIPSLAGAFAPQRLSLLVGQPSGEVRGWPIDAWTGTRASATAMVMAREGVLFAWMNGSLTGQGSTAVVPALVAISPGNGLGEPQRVKGRFGEVTYPYGVFELRPPALITSNGLAVYQDDSRRVLWFDAAGGLQARPWPGRPVRPADDSALPWIALGATADGTWIAAELTTRSVRLVRVAPDGVPDTRLLTLAPQPETGAGILVTGDDVYVALVALDEAGRAAIRVHRVDQQLRLGAPQTVPGTETPRGSLVPLTTCRAQPPAGAMDLAVPVEVHVGKQAWEATLLRRVRFDATSACLLRTMIAHDDVDDDEVTPRLRIVTQGGLEDPAVLAGPKQPLTGASCKLLP